MSQPTKEEVKAADAAACKESLRVFRANVTLRARQAISEIEQQSALEITDFYLALIKIAKNDSLLRAALEKGEDTVGKPNPLPVKESIV